MKRNTLYKWLCPVAMSLGIPMMYGCAKLYGPPPPDGLIIQDEKVDSSASLREPGEIQLNDASELP